MEQGAKNFALGTGWDIHNVLSAYFSYLVMATKDGHNIFNLKIDANLA